MSRAPRFDARVPTIKTERPREFDGIERRDCAVLALAAVLCIEYRDAHVLLTTAGKRKPRSGTSDWQVYAAIRAAGYDVREHDRPRIVKSDPHFPRFTRTHSASALRVLDYVPRRGHFYITTTSHAFAVIDGIVYDNGGLRSGRGRITTIIEVIF